MPGLDSETMQMVDPTAISPGSDFGPRYRIEAVLGQGGMGRVYRAYDKDLDRVVALKVVRPGMVGEPDALKRFKQELLLASRISHKNILRIHDMGEFNGMKFITMAYVEGLDLQKIIQENPRLPIERVLGYSQQLAEALAAAHSEGVLHRDLKPQNILVGKNDQIFISDFGLAKSIDDGTSGMTKTGAFVGTPRYMSPEQVEGKPADLRSDLYAFGLILYEMAVGDVPFTGESTLKVMYQRIQEKPKNPKTINPDLPNWFVRIIMRCLEKDPAARYQNAYEILADLQGAKSGSSASRTVQIQIPEFAERKWLWWVTGAVLILGIAFALPPVRHRIFGGGGSAGSDVAGVPALSQGKFVAILPFQVLGDDQSLSYVAQGLNDALNAKLFQLKDIRLASDSAVANVSAKASLQKAARELGSNLIVSGQVQGDASQMRIIVSLHDVADSKRVWSQEFSGVPKDLLTIEDQISSQLIGALDIKPTNEELATTTARPTNNVDAYDLYLRGEQALRGPDPLKAAQSAQDFFEQSIKQDPGFALAYAGLSNAALIMYENKKDNLWAQKAIDAAQHAEQLKDTIPEVHFTLGTAYLRTGKTVQAIAELKRGLQLNSNSQEGYDRLGNAYLDNGQQDEAIATFKKSIEVDPYYWGSHIDLGDAYLSAGENTKALAEFQRVVELDPENVGGWNNVGYAYARLGKYQDSIQAFQKSISLSPSWLSYSNLSDLYLLTGQNAEAVQSAEKAVEMSPNEELAVGNLADAYRASGQQEKASAEYDKAIAMAYKDLEVNPKSTMAMRTLAVSYAKKGDASHGMEFIQRAREIDKTDVTLIYYQATVENLANKPSDAIRTLREALSKGYPAQEAQVDPDFANLRSRPEFQQLMKEFNKPVR
jgi:eukaryotic-like serine/threonine-protein kinase